MPTPYITPEIIANAPTGVPWSIIPYPQATLAAMVAEQTSICWRASAQMDRICNQPLRATLDIEEEVGPDFRLTVDNNTGVGHLQASRWPVLQVLGGQVSPAASFPPSWSPIPASAMRAHTQLIGAYGTSTPGTGADGPSQIDIAPGYVSWWAGRGGFRLQAAYLNGWPHAGITGASTPAVSAGSLLLSVDDVTAFTGAAPIIYDGASTEQVSVLSVTSPNAVTVMGTTVPVGPGTLNLAAPLQYNHNAGVVVSALPADAQLAGILLCAGQALEAGLEAIALADIHGNTVSSGGGVHDLQVQAEVILAAYARVL